MRKNTPHAHKFDAFPWGHKDEHNKVYGTIARAVSGHRIVNKSLVGTHGIPGSNVVQRGTVKINGQKYHALYIEFEPGTLNARKIVAYQKGNETYYFTP